MTNSIGIIGFGNMGKAIAKGISRSDKNFKIFVYDRIEGTIEQESEGFKITPASSAKEVFKSADTIIFAVKPQDIPGLLMEVKSLSKGKGIISVIAGKPIDFFSKHLKTYNLCRFMPNIAAQEGRSATAVSFHEKAEVEFMNHAVSLAESIGDAYIIQEKHMSAFTGLSGSGIAFVFQLINAMALGGVKLGLSYKDSVHILASTIEGAASIIRESGKMPFDLITDITSPAGTTIEGLSVLEQAAFNSTLIDAVEAVAEKAEKIESGSV